MNIKSDYGCGNVAGKSRDVDLALAVLCCLVRPGQCLSSREISEITGMSHGGAYVIEKRALKKLRLRLRYTTHRKLGQEAAA